MSEERDPAKRLRELAEKASFERVPVPLTGSELHYIASTLEQVEAERDELQARLDALNGPHVLILGLDRWTIEHSLECRESGHMADCDVHERVARWIDDEGEPSFPKGRYEVGAGPLPAALKEDKP